MKRDFAKLKKIAYPYSYLLLVALFLNLLLSVGFSAVAQPDTEGGKESFTPALIKMEGVGIGRGDDVSLYLSRDLVMINGQTRK